jgi:predicted amidophosphoribosyltransferase
MRIRKTESQTTKTRAERADNMQGAFLLADSTRLNGKHVLLLDDVLTTGATIEACANVLLSAQNVKISIATIGIAIS